MKSPVDTTKGRIVDISPTGELTIKAHCDDFGTLIKRGYKECTVMFKDSRSLSDKQRRSCYALLRAISDYTGMGLDPTKEFMKLKFISEDLQMQMEMFSLSDASMSLVASFQRFLVRFIIDWEIPCDFSLLDYVDDIGDYLYACTASHRCCVCGRHADIFPIGRLAVGEKVLPLCGAHMEEAENSFDKFKEMYHINDGITLDKHLSKEYGIKSMMERMEEC